MIRPPATIGIVWIVLETKLHEMETRHEEYNLAAVLEMASHPTRGEFLVLWINLYAGGCLSCRAL